MFGLNKNNFSLLSIFKKINLFCYIFFILYSCNSPVSFLNPSETSNNLKIHQYNDNNFKEVFNDIKNARSEKNSLLLGKIYFEVGYYYLNKNISDSAFYYFNHSKEEFLIQKDSSHIGVNLINMAILQANEGDYFGSEETAVEALKYLKSPEYNSFISSVYNCLAISKTEQKDYAQAIDYYTKSLNYTVNKLDILSIKNNQAVIYLKNKEYNSAIKQLTKLLETEPELYNHPIILAKIEDNLAYAKWLNNPKYNAEPELIKTLKIREKENDLQGQIANHSHLSRYFAKTNPLKAVYHAKLMYKIAKKVGTPDDQLEALQKLTLLENPSEAKKHFVSYFHLNDSIQTKRSKAKNQFALIRYEVEKNKEENLQLKALNAQKNYQILKQRVLVFSITGVTIIILIILITWYKRRKEKFKQEKLEEVHKTEIKYSKKVHDEVANGIYYLMIQLENNSDLNSSKIINNLEELYNRSRNISHESEFKTDLKNDFANLLKDMLQPYGKKDTKIILLGNNKLIWEDISIKIKEELYYVIIELMTNMKKHSWSSLVTLKFKEKNKVLIIDYFDNGVGISSSKNWKPGKGLKNIENRINTINGKILYNIEYKKGFSVKIIINLQK